jgi:hypothetical protein
MVLCEGGGVVCTVSRSVQARYPHLQQVLPSAASYIKHALHSKDIRPVWLPVPQQRLCPLAHPAAVQRHTVAGTSSSVSHQSLCDASRADLFIVGGSTNDFRGVSRQMRAFGDQAVLTAAG